MIKNFTYRNIYFLGIGGIGMSALARYFHANGIAISGYDKTPSPITDSLIEEGIEVIFNDQLSAIPEYITHHPSQSLIIYTPAIPKNHPQLNFFINENYILKKRAEVLGLISKESHCIAVAGTHGKTTTSSLLSHLLNACNVNFSCFLGGISTNLGSNYIHKINGQNITTKPLMVVEADEFDRSFLHLNPSTAIITSCDPDHLDIYENAQSFLDGFNAFINNIQENGLLYKKYGLPLIPFVHEVLYGVEQGETRAVNLKFIDHQLHFDLIHNDVIYPNWIAGVPGKHNIENATAAIAVCLDMELPVDSLKIALAQFKGVKRRFEYIVNQPPHIVIDDYAHHPGELDAIIGAVKELYPNKKITGIFQPHLFSRTKDFAQEFAHSLSALDEIILMEIYPARETPIPGINAHWLLNFISHTKKSLKNTEEIIEELTKNKPDILLILGAGDIDRMIPLIKEVYHEN